MKFCKDCKYNGGPMEKVWVSYVLDTVLRYEATKCLHPNNMAAHEPVSGDLITRHTAEEMRHGSVEQPKPPSWWGRMRGRKQGEPVPTCGPDGDWWEAGAPQLA